MNARTLNGLKSIRACRPPLPFAVVVVLAALTVAFALGAGREAATAVEGEEATAGADMSSDPVGADPASGFTADPTEVPPAPEPTATEPAMPTPPAEAPVEVPTAVFEPTPTEPVAGPAVSADLTPTAVATVAGDVPIDGLDAAVRAAAESTTIEIGNCLPAPGSTDEIDQGGASVYDCAASITVASVPAFFEMELDWTVTADITPGWTAELRRHDSGGNGGEEEWVPGPMPGLGVIELLGPDADMDEDAGDDTFTYEVHFGVRLNAPTCGGLLDPDVTFTPSVLPTIDGIAGWRRHGELSRPLRPSLAVAAPAAALSQTATGALNDAIDPLRFSHSDQTVDAGTMELTVTSGYCGGWNVSISATDFVSQAAPLTFSAANLWLTATDIGPGVSSVPAAPLPLSSVAQSIFSAQGQPIPAGAYAYSFNLTLTIPGGTPAGTYISIVTVTTSAAP